MEDLERLQPSEAIEQCLRLLEPVKVGLDIKIEKQQIFFSIFNIVINNNNLTDSRKSLLAYLKSGKMK